MTERVFVAPERELAQLQTFLDQALAGHGQVCFVTGEAGAGKTALVTEFARRALVSLSNRRDEGNATPWSRCSTS